VTELHEGQHLRTEQRDFLGCLTLATFVSGPASKYQQFIARINGGVQSNDSHVEGFLEGYVYLRWGRATDFSADWAKCRPFEPELGEHKASDRGVLGRAGRPHGKRRLVARSKNVVTLAFPVLKCCVHPKQIANEHSHWLAVSFTLAGIVFGVRTRTERRVLMLTVNLPAVKD
jgi:hypothetical protein